MAGQQISIEAGFESYRERATELFHENVLLKAQNRELQAQLEQLTAPAESTPQPYAPPSPEPDQAMR
ncbi:hypothetical protein ACWERY_16315 [Streptomyces sp. NPDC004082]